MASNRAQGSQPLPDSLATVEALEDVLSTPQAGLVEALSRLEGDILILGAGGKVGPTLARMARRAAPQKKIVAVARFSEPGVRKRMQDWGIETLVCDLLDRKQVVALPHIPNVIYMAGKKFGTAGQEPVTWAMNAVVPTHVADHFRDSRIIAFSTLCVYPFARVDERGPDESVPPSPVGEYSNFCMARERIFQYFSQRYNTPGRIIRLNYAIDLRYGVLHDIATRVRDGRLIDLRTGHANVIWQGDATNQILSSLLHCEVPSAPLNIGRPEAASIREIATAFGKLFGRAPVFEGSEEPIAWVNDCALAIRLFGVPPVSLEKMIRWNFDWLQAEKPVYDKPTHYDQRAGVF